MNQDEISGLLLVDSEEDESDDEEDTSSKMIEKFRKMKESGKKIKTITSDMFFE